MVDESPSDDNSVAILHPNTMEALGLFRYVVADLQLAQR
jgi:transitional endoplasmic reticulum ATPase